MAIVYRAIWDSGDPAIANSALAAFRDWVQTKLGPTWDSSELASFKVESTQGAVLQAGDGNEAVLVAGLIEEQVGSSGDPSTWTTTLRAWSDQESHWVWVDVALAADDAFARVDLGAPRLVSRLLLDVGRPRLGSSRLYNHARPVRAGGVQHFVEHLRDGQRVLPVVVFTEAPGTRNDFWLKRADAVALRLSGLAEVRTLDLDAVQALSSELSDLSVWGGAVRTYVPAPLDRSTDGWRHRYVPHYRLGSDSTKVASLLINQIAPRMARRRPPESWEAAASRLAASHADAAATSLEAEPAASPIAVEENFEDLYLAAAADQEELSAELSQLRGVLERIQTDLQARGLEEVVWFNQSPTDSQPDEAEDVSHAALLAQEYLADDLGLPDAAIRDVIRLDTAAESRVWGQTTWRGLRALAAYARARRAGFAGGFWEWCQRGDALSWPATPKKLSMVESETLRNNKKLWAARLLPVDLAVSPDGEVYMEKHLKISEGGGDLAPRIYFHDDTGGATGKVHVGFIGPHYLVPNSGR